MIDRAASTERGWLWGAVVAGFVGTVVAGVVVVIGYFAAAALAGLPGELGVSFVALTRNVATEHVGNGVGLAILVHFAVGLILAIFYARVAEPRLRGPGWRRGMLFSLLPWLLSLIVFLPLVGGGFLGLGLGAGLLPALGNLVAHLAYGAALGWSYARERAELREEDEESALANIGAERGIAFGIVIGGVLGALVTGLGSLAAPASTGAPGWNVMLGGVGGATIGAFVGSYAGLGRPTRPAA